MRGHDSKINSFLQKLYPFEKENDSNRIYGCINKKDNKYKAISHEEFNLLFMSKEFIFTFYSIVDCSDRATSNHSDCVLL
jgi:hypothetical protein